MRPSCVTLIGIIITPRTRRMTEGNIFSLFTPGRGGGGCPILPDGGTPSGWWGYPIWLTGRPWGTPHLGLNGGNPLSIGTGWRCLPCQDWMGVPPPPPPPYQETEQQSEHLLCGGRYDSCVQAGEFLVNDASAIVECHSYGIIVLCACVTGMVKSVIFRLVLLVNVKLETSKVAHCPIPL